MDAHEAALGASCASALEQASLVVLADPLVERKPLYNSQEKLARFAGAAILEANAPAILVECEGILRDTISYHEIDPNQSIQERWRVHMLIYMHEVVEPNSSLAPITSALLQRCIREGSMIRNAFFSVLPAHACISTHSGYMASVLRYHLGLRIPARESHADPACFLEVGGLKYAWKSGEGLLWDDMFLHAAHNHSNAHRTILFLDVVRTDLSAEGREADASALHFVQTHKDFREALARAAVQSREPAPSLNLRVVVLVCAIDRDADMIAEVAYCIRKQSAGPLDIIVATRSEDVRTQQGWLAAGASVHIVPSYVVSEGTRHNMEALSAKRNFLYALAWRAGYDFAWMLDADVLPPPHALETMLGVASTHSCEAVGCAYRMTYTDVPVVGLFDGDSYAIADGHSVPTGARVAFLPDGCLLLGRKAMTVGTRHGSLTLGEYAFEGTDLGLCMELAHHQLELRFSGLVVPHMWDRAARGVRSKD